MGARVLSLYQKLIRNAWKSGKYLSKPEDPKQDSQAADDRESLRDFLRSKMEWIVEREAYEVLGPETAQQKEPKMKLAQYVKFREEKFGGVLFETRSEKVFTLSPTGAAVVKEIVAGGGDADILTRLKDKYQGDGASIEKDGAEFIASLREKGLIVE
jgi:hypothetical protein